MSGNSGVIVHVLHKCASMFLFRFFGEVAHKTNCLYYSTNSDDLEKRLNKFPRNINESFYCCPLRQFALGNYQKITSTIEKVPRCLLDLNDCIENVPISRIYQIRDPRDILVSQYFSHTFIHAPITKGMVEARKRYKKMTVDEYCLESIKNLRKRYDPIHDAKGNYIIVKYEDMVLNYRKWLSQIASFISIPKDLELALYHQFKKEFIPRKESMRHKRKMIPGDYKEKLKKSTINELNSQFARILETFYS